MLGFSKFSVAGLFLIGIIANVQAKSLPKNSTEINENVSSIEDVPEHEVEKLLMDFRDVMKSGKASINMPVLDPAKISPYNYSIINSPIGFRMFMQFGISKVDGLSSFSVKSIAQDEDGSGMKIKLSLPNLTITGDYSAMGNVFGFFPLLANGEYTMTVKDQTIVAEMAAFDDKKLEFLGKFRNGNAKAKFNNKAKHGEFGGVVTELLNEMGNLIYDDQIKPVLSRSINTFMTSWLAQTLEQ